eukprot:CAMPEP_0180411468 /NCGR_PEP_ID=MMETSP0989-20121125/43992_1 /TAXON_ID=697907 /ORGANISM="non described non described, Strain CCMP2293" /LENGTH=103 /DNA_ID=CAMNT_0022415807 /DNA_START=18 /DNA_END=326 /DNA_ORIENTATION=+
MISVSCIYHWAKIALVSMDASNKCSPRLGIMSLLIDHWCLDTLFDRLVTAKRVLLQGLDTATHLGILVDVGSTYPSLAPTAVCVAVVWSVHTAMCQVTGKSTA